MAEAVERQAVADQERCRRRQEQARQAVRGVAEDYHPFDANNGRPATAAAVGQRREGRLRAVEEVVQAAGLGASSREALAKARCCLAPLVASLAWFWQTVEELVAGLGLTAAQGRAFREQLLAGLYWQREAARGRDAAQRQQRQGMKGY